MPQSTTRLAILLLGLGACGHGSPAVVTHGGSAARLNGPPPAPGPVPAADSVGTTSSSSSDWSAPAREASSPPPSIQQSSTPRARREPSPHRRPGLGTLFGENRVSRVQHRAFDRATTSPFAQLSVYYNDVEGVAAQMAYRGREGLSPYSATTPGGGITVTLQGADGRLLPGRLAGGRTYVVGRSGQRYAIVIRNHTGGRFEVVASVDGLDVIDGKSASVHKRGYLLPPHGKLVIDGYRRSSSTVAAFRFGRVADSYAARTGSARNVGVIGMAFFAEQGSEWTTDELQRRESADPFPRDRGYAQPPPSDLAR